MVYDAIAIGLLALFIVLGVAQGAVGAALRLLTLVGAYAAALIGAPRIAPWVGETGGLPDFAQIPAAGALLFVCTFVALGLLARAVTALERRWRRGRSRPVWDRFGGGALGLVRGALIVLLVGVLGQWTEALRATGQGGALPKAEGSSLVAVTRTVVATGSKAAFGEEDVKGRMTVRALSDPARMVEGLQALSENPRVIELQQDALFWTYVSNGSYDAALNRGTFLGVAHDETLRRQLSELGLIDAASAEDPVQFRRAAREVLVEVGPRLRRLEHDPAIRRLAEDPEVRDAIARGDTLALLGNPELRQVVERVMAGGEEN